MHTHVSGYVAIKKVFKFDDLAIDRQIVNLNHHQIFPCTVRPKYGQGLREALSLVGPGEHKHHKLSAYKLLLGHSFTVPTRSCYYTLLFTRYFCVRSLSSTCLQYFDEIKVTTVDR